MCFLFDNPQAMESASENSISVNHLQNPNYTFQLEFNLYSRYFEHPTCTWGTRQKRTARLLQSELKAKNLQRGAPTQKGQGLRLSQGGTITVVGVRKGFPQIETITNFCLLFKSLSFIYACGHMRVHTCMEVATEARRRHSIP